MEQNFGTNMDMAVPDPEILEKNILASTANMNDGILLVLSRPGNPTRAAIGTGRDQCK